ncbi:MAG: hypothetical protein PHG80_09740 [Methanoregulaceae archaeon]|nr:hypothetical protein [Methanoregulaceae archaeon]
MYRRLVTRIIFMLLLVGLLWNPATAFNVEDIKYNLGIYNEQSDYTLQTADTVPDTPDWISGSDTITQDAGSVVLVRHPLVAYPGTSVEIELLDFITDVPVSYESDLDYPQVFLNNQLVEGNAIMGSGTIRVKGIIPTSAGLNEKVRVIHFPDADDAMNARFLVTTTTPEQAMAKESLFAASQRKDTGIFGISKTDIGEAIEEFNAGNFADSTIRSQIAMEKADIRMDGIILGLLIGAVAALVTLAAGWYLGKQKGREIERRPDLLNIEAVILRYFDLKVQQKKEIPKWCGGMIEKAFEINTRRAESLAAMTKPGETINPEHPDLAHLHPSLFQAFYEKSRFGRCRAFDEAIDKLFECLHVPFPDGSTETSRRTLHGLFRKQ